MTIYWLAVLFSLTNHQQVGHLDAEFTSAQACHATARAAGAGVGGADIFPVCVVMIRTDPVKRAP